MHFYLRCVLRNFSIHQKSTETRLTPSCTPCSADWVHVVHQFTLSLLCLFAIIISIFIRVCMNTRKYFVFYSTEKQQIF